MRNHSKNTHTDVRWLMISWDDTYFDQSMFIIHWSDWRINHHGETHNFDGTIFSKNHPLFLESIELWVRDLVVILIKKFNCITYNSCQWHKNSPKRRVGILPRNHQELEYIYTQLLLLTNQKSSAYWAISILRTELLDYKTQLHFPIIDIVIDSYSICKLFPFFLHKRILDVITNEFILSLKW